MQLWLSTTSLEMAISLAADHSQLPLNGPRTLGELAPTKPQVGGSAALPSYSFAPCNATKHHIKL